MAEGYGACLVKKADGSELFKDHGNIVGVGICPQRSRFESAVEYSLAQDACLGGQFAELRGWREGSRELDGEGVDVGIDDAPDELLERGEGVWLCIRMPLGYRDECSKTVRAELLQELFLPRIAPVEG